MLEGNLKGDMVVSHAAGIARYGGRRTVFDFWMVGPSAMGSVKGIPSSMMSGRSLVS